MTDEVTQGVGGVFGGVEVHEVGVVVRGGLLHAVVQPLLHLVQEGQRLLGDVGERQFRPAVGRGQALGRVLGHEPGVAGQDALDVRGEVAHAREHLLQVPFDLIEHGFQPCLSVF
ncbi:hypothetical protein C6Y14_43320 [Streptomyces dioscori]|uniref:Uncharacterized protein n=1 Tax=Streptomyces dioscori TaxID=2109333 RepID=A0A2P8PTA3_9ACTN|nr:hypothetical protein C6Y14_43320 [Streptomyces dioscori]